MIEGVGASKPTLDDAQNEPAQVTGVRKSAKGQNDPNTPADDETANQHSASQMSFENRRGTSILMSRFWRMFVLQSKRS